MTQPIDIAPQDMKTLHSLLSQHLPGVTAWAYGSRVKWNSRPNSDLDLVVFAPPERRPDVAALRTACDESNLPFRVDLFVWDEVPEKFRKTIEAEHVAVQVGRAGDGGAMEEYRNNQTTIPVGWRECTLGEVVTLQRGHDLPKTDRGEGVVPVLGSFGVTGYHDEARAPAPGVTVGRSGASFGVVSYSSVPYWPLNTALYAIDFHGNDERFVYYFLKSLDFASFNTGSAQPSLNRNHIHPIPVCIPAPLEQRAIAGVLGALDDKIEQNRRTAQALEDLARAIFQAWFVDFEPVKAKSEGATSFPSMPQRVFDALPTRFVDSDIGLVPEGWEAGRLGSLLKESTRRNLDERICLVLSAVNTGELVASDDHFTKRVYSKSLSNYKVVPSGAIAFNPSRINIGSVGVNHRDVDGVVSPVYVVCTAPCEYEWFFEFYLRLATVRKQFETLSSGSVRQSLRVVDFLSIELAVPNRELVLAFNHEFMNCKRLLNALDVESQKLTEISDYLFPKLLGGNIRMEVDNG
ncbi:MAG: restriction endonuclease subunit S [Kiritimatiellae bacterium]|nr:restriction endonuclease subunit S [Kiritimatiellia bacterium]